MNRLILVTPKTCGMAWVAINRTNVEMLSKTLNLVNRDYIAVNILYLNVDLDCPKRSEYAIQK